MTDGVLPASEEMDGAGRQEEAPGLLEFLNS